MLQSNQKIIRHKVGRRNLAEELGTVSKACQGCCHGNWLVSAAGGE